MPNLHSVDLVIPVYNEEEALELFHRELRAVVDALPYACAIYYINDGSSDGTQQILQRLADTDRRIHPVEFSRNFGHQAALTAGLDLSTADVVISLDGDGQHPPELIPQMIELYCSGYDMVLTQRIDTEQPSVFKRWTSAAFYRLINRMGDTQIMPGGADYRLMSRAVVDVVKHMREYQRFLRGMVAWVGYRTVTLPYHPAQRLAGKSKYTLKKMLTLAANAVFSFSLVPLQIGLVVGGLFFLLALAEVIYVVSLWITGRPEALAPGWSSLMFMLLIVGGTLMVLLSFIGIYVGYIYQEVKGRPIYIIRPSDTPQRDEKADPPAADPSH